MTRVPAPALILTLFVLVAPVASAKEFHESYEEGLKSARGGDWNTVIQKMTEAIAKKPGEGKKVKFYGVVFRPYFPFYYRGVAYLKLNRLAEAAADLQKATGVGELDLGSVESNLEKTRAVSGGGTGPGTTTTRDPGLPPVIPPTNTTGPRTTTQPPVNPAVDPAIGANRTRAESMLRDADRRMAQARSQKADSFAAKDFATGQQLFLDAKRRAAGAESASDWNEVLGTADRSKRAFDLAISTAEMQASTINTSSVKAADDALAATKGRLQRALDDYFTGNFKDSSRELEKLAKDQPRNAMIWAFLGASQYSVWYLSGEENPEPRRAAENSFRQALKQKPNLQLDSRYFSPRIRKFFVGVRP